MHISLDKLAGGAAAEKLNIELAKLAANVMDPNTKAEAARTVTLTIAVKPNKQRQVGDVEINVKSSLAHSTGIPTAFTFDFDTDGAAVLKELPNREHDPNQTQLSDAGDVTDGHGKSLADNKVVGMYR
ncbi:hypothetical protein [Paenibacillus antibioticophila]|uniref:hypothetical protein n=1 Tax=Paenibacillus antibioticophila TaxID=1274374 RepID=UPI000677F54F|nr:hypothetical protein [Paenibacillus antibioticophila]